ncbi:MAG TPA: transcriptional regulator FNR [Gammaproteobacteria bacterium]|uniref:fumarate/nitrate reduction transcriptional regulator Fnr n=1 Tax=Immundisolibacter sp. TaxID=1934948 RepID=UPI000E7E7BA1|nr:transcriptional regulator FNR [Gammaproteobacteria bacterium]HCZ47478.1 transcriptional regulator FNR [Gammaproteobacteria bacterium]MCH76916.1 transcriptional regulator FNR [Gammaproteobacteria bacterium]
MAGHTPSDNVFSLGGLKASCATCNLHDLCLPRGMSDADVAELEHIVSRSRSHPRGKTLFRVDEPFRAIYVPRSGAIKTFTLGIDGSEQIIGFHLPGEIIGLDGLIEHQHQVTAQALELSSVCEVAFDLLEHAAARVPALQHQLMRLMSQEIAGKEQQLLALGDHLPERRLGLLLLDLSQRFAHRGFSATEFNLPMSRQDIAAYLRLAAETVSRAFGKLQRDGLVEVTGRLVRIVDLDALTTFAGQGAGSTRQRNIS